MGIHIQAPRATAKRIQAGQCPDCKKRTRFVGFFTPWYGWSDTCLRCGRNWKCGERISLPFMPRARAANITAAKKQWRAMPPVSANSYGE